MSYTLDLSEKLYEKLEATAQRRGLSIQELIEMWQQNDDELERRQRVVREINTLRESLYAAHGEMPDSVELVREDRERLELHAFEWQGLDASDTFRREDNGLV